jgi:hypothetical protein
MYSLQACYKLQEISEAVLCGSSANLSCAERILESCMVFHLRSQFAFWSAVKVGLFWVCVWRM